MNPQNNQNSYGSKCTPAKAVGADSQPWDSIWYGFGDWNGLYYGTLLPGLPNNCV